MSERGGDGLGTVGDVMMEMRRCGNTGGMMEGRKPQPSPRPLAIHDTVATAIYAGNLRSSSVAREGEVLSDIVSRGPKPLSRSCPLIRCVRRIQD